MQLNAGVNKCHKYYSFAGHYLRIVNWGTGFVYGN